MGRLKHHAMYRIPKKKQTNIGKDKKEIRIIDIIGPVIKKKKRRHIPRPELCKFCNKHFKDSGALRKHVKYAHFEGDQCRPFVCKVCNKGFARKYCLQSHWKTHAKNRTTYQCQRC